MRSCLLLACIALLSAADPVISVDTVRHPIAGRRVRCFVLYANQLLADAVTVTVAYGGTASSTTDFTGQTTITLPSGMPTTQGVFVPIKCLGTDAVGKSVTMSIQNSSGYTIDAVHAAASTTIAGPLSASDVFVMGEPDTVEVAAGSAWTYKLNVRHPSQLQGNIPLPVPIFNVIADLSPGASDYSSRITITPQTVSSDAVPFQVSFSTSADDAGHQFRFRLKIEVDVDGDQHYVPYFTPAADGQPSEDIFTEQDLVINVTHAGPG